MIYILLSIIIILLIVNIVLLIKNSRMQKHLWKVLFP